MTSKQAAWRVACARLVRLSTDMSSSAAQRAVLDEVIHHGAEVGLLRDLYSQRSSLHG
jgi:hypothetical protein